MRHYLNKTASIKLADLQRIDRKWDTPLSIRCYKNARILPPHSDVFLSGGVCDANGLFIEDTALHEEYYDGSYDYDENLVNKENRDAIFIGSWIGIYGHAITDNLKKLWPLLSATKSQYFMGGGNLDVVYNYLSGGKLPAYITTILSILGIDESKLKRLDKVTQYNNVYVPDNAIILSNGVRYYTSDYKQIIKSIVDACHMKQEVRYRVYLTRSKIHDGKDFGEKSIEDIFKKEGYQIISPEMYSFVEQVNLMNNCSDIVATEGSVSHNALFCRDGSNLVLLRKYDSFNGYQLMINNMNHLNVTYIDANHTLRRKKTPWAGPFFLWNTTFLKAYFNDTTQEESKWLSILWYIYMAKYFWLCYFRPALGRIKRIM